MGSISPLAPAGKHGSVTLNPARRAIQGSLTPEDISLENVTSQGVGPGTIVPPALMTSEVNHTPGHQINRAPMAAHMGSPRHVTQPASISYPRAGG